MSERNNYLDETLTGMDKVLTLDSDFTDEELIAIKAYLTGYSTLSDMDDIQKENILNATNETIAEVVREAFKQTIIRTYRIRYGIIYDQGE